ncbi:hypothetical protein A2U01_0082732, partial [Trifolium medium]|nr:hypothetical protein [Trifolium medium]
MKKCQAIELRNRAMEIVEKPKDGKKEKDPDSRDTHEKQHEDEPVEKEHMLDQEENEQPVA